MAATTRIIPSLLLVMAAAPVLAKPATDKPTDIAIQNLEAREGVTKAFGELMSDVLRTELYKTGRFTVMNREDMDAILKEIKFQQSGACDQTSCIVEMGQALGVGKMVAGSVGLFGSNYVITAKLIDIAKATNEVLATENLPKDSPNGPQPVFRKLALKLAGLEESLELVRAKAVHSSHGPFSFGALGTFDAGSNFNLPDFPYTFGSGGAGEGADLEWRFLPSLALKVEAAHIAYKSGHMNIPDSSGNGSTTIPGPWQRGFQIGGSLRYLFSRKLTRFFGEVGYSKRRLIVEGSSAWKEQELKYGGLVFALGFERDLGSHLELQSSLGVIVPSSDIGPGPGLRLALNFVP